MIKVQRLNHAVLFVSELETAVKFYTTVFEFTVVAKKDGQAAFLRAKGSDNHHDLGLFALGAQAQKPARGTIGLYHLAWQVKSIQDLLAARQALEQAHAFNGESDHGATKSVYGFDPDGNEFEIMYLLPRQQWGPYENAAPILPLNWEKELS